MTRLPLLQILVLLAALLAASAVKAETVRTKLPKWEFGGQLKYDLKQDLADEREPKIMRHAVAAQAAAQSPSKYEFSFMAGAETTTIGREIESSGESVDTAVLGDVAFAVGRGFVLPSIFSAKNLLEASLGVALPTSESSQYEGLKSAPQAEIDWTLAFQGGRYVIVNKIEATYLAQTYSHSPVSGEVNPDSGYVYTLAASAALTAGVRITLGGAAQFAHHFDQTVTSSFTNFQALSWTYDRFTASLSHANGSREIDQRTNFVFVDETKRIVALGLGVKF